MKSKAVDLTTERDSIFVRFPIGSHVILSPHAARESNGVPVCANISSLGKVIDARDGRVTVRWLDRIYPLDCHYTYKQQTSSSSEYNPISVCDVVPADETIAGHIWSKGEFIFWSHILFTRTRMVDFLTNSLPKPIKFLILALLTSGVPGLSGTNDCENSTWSVFGLNMISDGTVCSFAPSKNTLIYSLIKLLV